MAGRRALRLEGASGPRLLAWRRMARVLSLSGRLPSKGGSILRSVFLFRERLMSQCKRTKKWSAEVTAHSDALDLEPHVFSKDDPSEVAESLKRSAESSDRGAVLDLPSGLSLLITIHPFGSCGFATRRRSARPTTLSSTTSARSRG